MRQGMLEGRTGFRGKERKKKKEREEKEVNEWGKMAKNGRRLEKGEGVHDRKWVSSGRKRQRFNTLSVGWIYGDARARCRLCGSFDREIA